MTRRKESKLREQNSAGRKARIKKLLAVGWITSEAEIPADVIPVDPDRINLGGSYFHPTCYQAMEFTCSDCGAAQVWGAEDQRWYYEATGAPYYVGAKRCRPCRKKEQTRKALARIAAGHAKPKA